MTVWGWIVTKNGDIVLEVLYPRARVARYMPDGKGGVVVEYADPQPPVVVLLAAMRKAGIRPRDTGVYPASRVITAWAERKKPRWKKAEMHA
jgi:hypothetical protein